MVTNPPPAKNSGRLVRAVVVAIFGVAAAAVTMSSPGVAAAATPPSPSPPATAGTIGLRLLDEPASAGADPRARLYIVDNLSPGTVIHRQVEVSNTTTSNHHAVLYAAAASIANGAFIGAAGHTANDISTWTAVVPATVDIPARGTATVTVTITVPNDSASGERYGAIWAEVSTPSTKSTDITQINRVGIREYISISAGDARQSNFTIESMAAQRTQAGQPQVVAIVRNTGGRALDMSGALNLSAGPGGLRAGPFAATLGTTLGIGATEPVTFTLNKQLPAGPWTADVALASGLLQRSAQATLTFPNSGSSSAVGISTHSPWPRRFILTGLGLLLTGATARVLSGFRGRRRRATAAAHRRLRTGRLLPHS